LGAGGLRSFFTPNVSTCGFGGRVFVWQGVSPPPLDEWVLPRKRETENGKEPPSKKKIVLSFGGSFVYPKQKPLGSCRERETFVSFFLTFFRVPGVWLTLSGVLIRVSPPLPAPSMRVCLENTPPGVYRREFRITRVKK